VPVITGVFAKICVSLRDATQEKEKSHEKNIYCDDDPDVFNNGVRRCTGGKKSGKKDSL